MSDRNARERSTRRRFVSATVAMSMLVGLLTTLPILPAQAATTNHLALNVISARTEPRAFGGAGVAKGDAIPHFKFILNVDDTGVTAQRSPDDTVIGGVPGCSTSDPNYPDNCLWQSIKEPSGWSPIYAQGNEDDLAALSGLPDDRYLISVMADGYKIDGAHFCVDTGAPSVPGCDTPLDDSAPLTVELQPNPLPDGTVRALVFEDNAPTNGGPDAVEANLEGFVGHVADTLGEIQTDVYGNPLCTRYEGEDPNTYEIPLSALDADMLPVPIPGSGGECVSDANGMMAIPHLGSNRYTVTVTPPDGETWIQTTTLEGNHDYDAWIMEGDTGFDATFTRNGEPVPLPIFGFVKPLKNGQPLGGGTGHITGVVVGIKTYTPPIGGSFDFWGGNTGTKVGGPINRPWLSLVDLNGGDAAVWIGRGNADGSFDISGVPNGDYSLSWWDEPQDYNLNFINLTVRNGQTVRMGNLPLNGWWTEYDGYVFEDSNRNGVKDPGEKGVPNFTLTLRHRENNLYDRGQNTATTDANGHYYFESGYPIGEWVIMEAYSDSYYTTGVTYQTDNQPDPTTIKGAGVDVSVLPIIGLSGRIDWGVHAYDPAGTNGVDPRNGGIVGTVSYDTTRNELDPQYAATEDWQPGISGLPVELYAPIDCGTNAGAPCDELDRYELAPDGSYAQGQLLNTYLTESWERPRGCTARDVDGNPLIHGTDENVLVPTQEADGICISSFMQGVQFNTYPTDQGTPDANFGAAVNGNYGFGDGCFAPAGATDGPYHLDSGAPVDAPVCLNNADEPVDFTPLTSGDYLVHVAIPNDQSGNPMFKATGEEDINIGNGDQIIPQVPPPACAGPLHTVDLLGDGTDNYGPVTGQGVDVNGVPLGVTVPASNPVDNATFLDIGGSPYEGMQEPTCETKLVELNNGKSVVPIFNVFTDVPIPSRLRTVIIDDLRFSADPRSIMYGEKAGLAFAPVGIYDFANKLEYTTETDFNGIYDVLMPSTNHISCPTPSGVCANMYRFVANDPGIPGRLNPNYNPAFATHAAGAEAMPGVSAFADLAPTQVGITVETAQTGLSQPVTCPVDTTTPQLFTVSRPYATLGPDAAERTFTINGLGFGTAGEVTLDGTALATSAWSDTAITATVPANMAAGPHQLLVTRTDNGLSTVNGLTFHVLGTGYSPNVLEVGPGKSFGTIQEALDAAMATGDDLVVVYPGQPDLANPRNNPRGAYYENLIMASPVKLQGVGPGGFQGSTYVPGSIIDASSFNGDTAAATAWFDKVGAMTWNGNQNVNDGEAIYILASANPTNAANTARQFTENFKASIDGFDIRGGIQNGFPTNINDLTGGPTGLPPTIATQGGAIYANAYVRYLQITNNVVQNNGSMLGTIRLGTPDLPPADPGDVVNTDPNSHNENARIAHNRIIANAGTNLAGGIGLYNGSDNYEIARNDICGNFSLEYGGGLSVYGYSPNGKIHHNRIYLNRSNDEGGGIMIAGELPQNPADLSVGTGPVDIYANQIQSNLANDDGGGIRFLMAGGDGALDEMNIYNNMIVNNVSTHEGGGISLNDAPNVRIFNNTIMKNLTTATAVTSNGQPAPAGLATSANSDMMQGTLPPGSPTYSKPVQFNNIFWDNRAGTRAGTTVTGIGLTGDGSPINQWDMGVFGSEAASPLDPTDSVVQQNPAQHPYTTDASNLNTDPLVISPYDLSVSFATWRQNPAFVDATLVTVDAAPNLLGNYHLQDLSPAVDLGAASKSGVNAPTDDIDGDVRPNGPAIDSGADELPGGIVTPPTCPPDCPPPNKEPVLYFTTQNDSTVPGVAGPYDDADVYTWDGTDFGRVFDASSLGLPAGANVDALAAADSDTFYLSFSGTTVVPGLGTVQDEDIVLFDAGTWSRYFDGSDVGLANSDAEDVDAFGILSDGSVIVSTVGNGGVPGVGAFADEDLIRCVGTFGAATSCSWSRYFTGATIGLTAGSEDVDGASVMPTALFLSTNGAFDVGGFGGDGSDVWACNPEVDPNGAFDDCSSYFLYFDGSVAGITDNIDGFQIPSDAPIPTPPSVANVVASPNPTLGATQVSLTATATAGSANVTAAEWFVGADPGPGGGTSMNLTGSGPWDLSATIDVSAWANGAYMLHVRALDADGIWGPSASVTLIVGEPFPGLYFSTSGNGGIADVAGPYDDADLYLRDAVTFSRVFDATADGGLPAGANIDGFDRVDDDTFYVSFAAANTAVPGLGNVQDEDVVLYDAGTWSLYFDGTAAGLTGGARDIDAINIVGDTLYFSIRGNTNPPGVGGVADDADIYTWNGTSFGRAWNASANGLAAGANVDGFVRVDADTFYLSFSSASTPIAGFGTVQDEDVVFSDAGTWSVYFDGTAEGLTSGAQDVDAFDVP